MTLLVLQLLHHIDAEAGQLVAYSDGLDVGRVEQTGQAHLVLVAAEARWGPRAGPSWVPDRPSVAGAAPGRAGGAKARAPDQPGRDPPPNQPLVRLQHKVPARAAQHVPFQ